MLKNPLYFPGGFTSPTEIQVQFYHEYSSHIQEWWTPDGLDAADGTTFSLDMANSDMYKGHGIFELR